MKNKIFLILGVALFGMANAECAHASQDYCQAGSYGASFEHISKVSLNSAINPSGPGTYSDYSTLTPARIVKSRAYSLEVECVNSASEPGPEYLKAWIDYDGDGNLSSGEAIDFGSASFSGTHVYASVFSVPSDALAGSARMRLFLKYGNNPPEPCGQQGFGEVEDYTVIISDGLSYCESRAEIFQQEYIRRVELNTGSRSSNATPYSDYTSEALTGILRGSEYLMYVDAKASEENREYLKAWIDYNADGTFSESEEIDFGSYRYFGVRTFVSNLTVPVDATLGSTRMRVSLRYNYEPEACANLTYGEVEDYTVRISEAPPQTTTSTSTSTSTAPTPTTFPEGGKVAVTRSLPASAPPGGKIIVRLALDVNEENSPNVIGINENAPAGWSVSEASHGGIARNGSIEWLFWSQGRPIRDTAINYSLSAPSNASGIYVFSGEADCGETTGITGDLSITISPGCAMKGNQPPCETVELKEVIGAINSWAAGEATLEEVVALVNSWADPAGHQAL